MPTLTHPNGGFVKFFQFDTSELAKNGRDYPRPMYRYAMKSRTGKMGFVALIEVPTEQRGQGTGTELLTQALCALRDTGCDRVVLQVASDEDVPRLTRWYEQFGLTVIGKERYKYVDLGWVHDVFMGRELSLESHLGRVHRRDRSVVSHAIAP